MAPFTRRNRGFSFAELCVSLFLMSLLVMLGTLNMHNSDDSAQARAMATEILSEMRLAQAQAMATQSPVVLAIPTESGTKPCSGSLYLAQGRSGARPYRVVDYSKHYAAGTTFVGNWPLGSGLSATVTPPSGKALQIPLDAWLPASMKQDYCFVFTPDGSIVTNGLANFAGSYHLVVSSGIRCAAGSAPPGIARVTTRPADYTLQSAGRCYTISLSASGAISLESGLPGQDGSVVLDQNVGNSGLAAPLTLRAASTAAPVLGTITLSPNPDPVTLDTGVNFATPPGGYVGITTTATDPGGHDVYLRWECDGGSFSQSGETRMNWDQTKGLWTSTWQWQAPPDSTPGTHYKLTCNLRNDLNAVTVIPASEVRDVVTVPAEHIALSHFRQFPATPALFGSNCNTIWMMTGAGAGLREIVPMLANQTGIVQFRLSQLGNRLTYCINRAGGTTGVVVADNEGRTLTSFGGGSASGPAISPLGNLVAYWSGPRLYVSYTDGSNPRLVYTWTRNSFQWNVPNWSPDQRYLVCYGTSNDPTLWGSGISTTTPGSEMGTTASGIGGPANIGFSLTVVKVDGTGSVELGVRAMHGAFSPDPADMWIYYANAVDNEIWKIRVDGSNATKVSSLGGNPKAMDVASLNPTGTKVLFTSRDSPLHQLYTYDLGSGALKRLSTAGGEFGSWGL